MEKSEIKKYQKLLKEIDSVKRCINHLQPSKAEMVNDVVMDYSTGYPHRLVISGYISTYDSKRLKMIEHYTALLAESMAKLEQIEEYISAIPDNEMRALLRYRYILGFTYEKTAEVMHYSERTIIRREKEFFDGNL